MKHTPPGSDDRRLEAGNPHGGSPSVHAFAVGQTVRFFPNALQSPGFAGLYVIVRQLPQEAEGPQYQVRSVEGGQQRVVPEMQLRPLLAVAPLDRGAGRR